MTDIFAPQPKPGVMNIAPYVGGEGRFSGAEAPLRLASNENPLGCSPAAREAYIAAAVDLNRYPDGNAVALRNALAAQNNMDVARIVCGAGSDELIYMLAATYAGAGDEIIYSQYGFLRYAIAAKSVGAKPVPAPEKDMRSDVDALLAAVTPATKMVMIANPNNPTGTYLTEAEMQKLASGLPKHVLLVIDAAYAEFAYGAPDYADGRALTDAYPNVCMLRTFSKIYGLAALRLGWGYFPPAVADAINRVRSAFNASVPAQAAGVAAIADTEFVKETIEMVDAGRRLLTKGFEKMNLRFPPSAGNFLLVHFGPRAEEIRLALKEKGIFVRQMGAYGLTEHLRITISTERDNDRLLSEIRKLI